MCFGFDAKGALEQSLDGKKEGVNRRNFLRNALVIGAAGGLAVATGTAAATPAVALPGLGNLPGGGLVDDLLGKKGDLLGRKNGRAVPAGLISIQLYTMRSIMRGDGVDATLEKLAGYGYTRVELAGLYGRTASDIRSTLDELGIRSMSSHDGISANAHALETKIANAAILGQSYMNVPFLSSSNADDWRMWADQMNGEAEVAKKAGIKYGYHNHAHEFTTDLGGGLTPWDVFTSRLDKKLVHLEVDLYWAVTAGFGVGASDPEQFAIDVIRDAPQKVLQYHVKDRDEAGGFADLGTGTIDFARIFDAHKVKEYIVEQDQPDVTPLQSAEVGYDYVRALRY
jgi:sugar phosphate isomerase/epimerase